MKAKNQITKPSTQDSSKLWQTSLIAAWAFGIIILFFYFCVFFFAPSVLPDFKNKMLAIISSLLCGLFTFFFVGTLSVRVRIENKLAELFIQSTGGAAAFVLILLWWNSPG